MTRLGELQRKLRAAQVPVIIIFEGWHGAGKGALINSLVQAMDPRGFKVYTPYAPDEEERSKPFFWQFWKKLPAKGAISIFDRSWYGQVINKEAEDDNGQEWLRSAFVEICDFERLLYDDNHVIIKFFAHISEKTHKKRLTASIKDEDKDMRPTSGDKREIGLYKKLYELYEEMFARTDTAYAPWVAIEAEDEHYARIKVLDYLLYALEKKLAEIAVPKDVSKTDSNNEDTSFFSSVLSKVDLTLTIEPDEYKEKMDEYQKEIRKLQYKLFRQGVPTIIAFEGWDAAGKGGAIKRVTSNMDPRGYYVVPTSAPGLVDKNYNYLWRFWREMPAKGFVAIFDRTWYGRVMVERVEGFATEEEWRRAYREINDMEEELVACGAILLKFWLQISPDEQYRRFKAREENPQKQWKITDEDWRNREKRDKYEPAINEMLFRTSTSLAPWTLVEAECKHYGRLKVIKTIVEAMRERANSGKGKK
jgi:polyphosphate:AMP phosphotransferase